MPVLALVILALSGAIAHGAPHSRPLVTHPAPTARHLAAPAARMIARSPAAPAGIASGGTWVEVGPTDDAGPIQCATLDLAGTTLYLGMDEAGFFAGAPIGATSWTPKGDRLGFGAAMLVVSPAPALAARAIAKPARAASAGELWLAANHFGAIATSIDAGASWQTPVGLPANMDKIKRILKDPHGASQVFMLAHGDLDDGGGVQHGWHVLLSQDGGLHWTGQYYEGDTVEPDLWVPRVYPPTTAIYLISQGDLLVSLDEGLNWDDHGALPAYGDALLCGSEVGAPRLFAVVDGTLYRSSDIGTNWSPVQDVSGDTPKAIAAAPDDSNLVVWGGYHTFHSEDGGDSRTEFPSDWVSVQTDLHEYVLGIDCLEFPAPSAATGAPNHATTLTRRFYINTLGGTWAWNNDLSTAVDVTPTGCPNVQAWSTRTSSASQFDAVIGTRGRAQLATFDFGPGTTYPLSSYVNTIGLQVVGNVASSSPSRQSVWTDFGFLWCFYGGGIFECLARPADPSPVEFGPFVANPSNQQSIYWGGQTLWRVTRIGTNAYSPVALHNFGDVSGDLVTAFAIAPGPGNRMYAGTRMGRHFSSRDFGATWTQGTGVGTPFVSSYQGMGIAVNPADSTECWMGGAHGVLWHTVNSGASWSSESIGNDTNVYGLAYDNATDRHLYAASDAGPFLRGVSSWTSLAPLGSGVPVVPFYGVESLSHVGRMRFATFGRGLWDYVIGTTASVPPTPVAPLLALAVTPNPVTRDGVVRFVLPASGHVRVELFDVFGRRVRSLLDGDRPAGPGAAAFDARDERGTALASGLYLVRLTTPQATRGARFMVVR